jgi:hypothetical protein
MTDPRIKRILAMKPLTAEDENTWSMGPLGSRAGIYAVWDDGNAVYFDGDDNVLEPGWVLRILRGEDARLTPTADLLNHEWMTARAKNGPAPEEPGGCPDDTPLDHPLTNDCIGGGCEDCDR